MPRRTLARRFEPRFGVSDIMIETESRYVAVELENYLLLSLNDLKERLATGHNAMDHIEESLQSVIRVLPDRERIALRCLLTRDLRHLGKLYLKMLEQSPHAQASGATSVVVAELTAENGPRSVLAFKQTLFE